MFISAVEWDSYNLFQRTYLTFRTDSLATIGLLANRHCIAQTGNQPEREPV